MGKLAAWADRLFPGARVVRHWEEPTGEGPKATTKPPTASKRLARYLLETDAKEISIATLAAETGVPERNLSRTLGTRAVEAAFEARGWRKAPIRPQGWALKRLWRRTLSFP
jgi:hypothetical protein